MLVLNLGQSKVVSKIDVLKNALAQNPGISSIAASSQLPTNIITSEGVDTKDGKRHGAFFMAADKEIFNTLDIKFDRGKKQVEELIQDENRDPKTMKNNFVVNETFLKETGIKIDDIENQPIVLRHGNMQPGPIIGVVKDFHFESLHDPIGPLVFEFNPRSAWYNAYLLIKINSPDIPGIIDFIKQKWSGVAEGLPFDYHFLDADYNSLYRAEMQVGNLITLFTLVSLFIITLGLLGLIAFIANQKTKEIGVRKVLGASIGNILLLLSKKFIAWVLIANIIAVPAAYYFMNRWLQSFAYRIGLSWWIFALAGLITLIIALATVSIQAVKAAVANPVEALRYE